MKFKDFIQMDEVGTSTSCVASFKRMSIPLNRRIFPPELGFIDAEEKKGKKNPYRVPQIDEEFNLSVTGSQNSPMAAPQQQNPAQQTQPQQNQTPQQQQQDRQKQYDQQRDSFMQFAQQAMQDPNSSDATKKQLQQMMDKYGQLDNSYGSDLKNRVTNGIDNIGNAIASRIGQQGSLTANKGITGG